MNDGLKLVIIGGVAGGATAAARARRLSETSEITIIEKGPYVSFANCGLPYHISGVIPQRNSLLVQTPESLKSRFNIDVRINTEAIAINREKHTVTIKDLKSGIESDLAYDRIILSPGSLAFKPPIPGIDLPQIFTLQTIPDLDAIMKWISEKKVRRAAVIGGGFIGVEAAENLKERGIAVSIIEADKQVMPPIDPEMAELIHQHLRVMGVELFLEKKVKAIVEKNGALSIATEDGTSIETDMAILAIGVRPRSELAKKAGLETGPMGGITVNDRLQTSDPDIYAVGDAIEIHNPLSGLPGYIPLAGPANRQGRIAADQVFGRDSRYRGTMGTSICKIFSLSAGAVGVSEKYLKRMNMSYKKTIIHAGNHANYYPGSEPIALKLLFTPDKGAILGAQAIGTEGVDKRIDVIAAAAAGGLTVFDLEHLELSYAPPYSSAKDPVNMAGFTAANMIRGDHIVIHAEDIPGIDPAAALLLDVRTAGEYKRGNIPGSINIPVNELRPRMKELDKEKKIIIYCQVGLRGYVAQRMLTLSGFDAVNLSGGYKTWCMVNRLPV